jgi:hypothetical protein
MDYLAYSPAAREARERAKSQWKSVDKAEA